MKKFIFVMVLIFCLLTTSQSAYSYFESQDKVILNDENFLYEINQTVGNDLNTLIPLGAVLKENDTYYLTYVYEVYVEEGVELESEVIDVHFDNSDYTSEELEEIFNFDFKIDHVKSVSIPSGVFSQTTEGELVQITIEISMNDSENLTDFTTMFGRNLSFTYLLRVSKS